MWQVDNRTPFAAAQSWVRDLDGAETWIVVVKATFDIRGDGSLVVTEQQPPPVRSPVYRGEPGRSSLVYENDFVLAKKTTDIVVNGSAYAPGGRPQAAVDVGFRVGPVSKVLRVVGDRTWKLGGAMMSDAAPFVSMPIVYERAFGGEDRAAGPSGAAWHWPNPVGTAFLASDRGIGEVRLPNVEYPDEPMRSWKARPRAAGFGVIGSNWEERAKLTGTYDAEWERERQPLLPRDFDLRHFQAVPRDQQAPAFLSGGESVSLVNLTPSGSLQFALPTVHLRLETRFVDGERREHPPAKLHSVIVEPDVPRVSLVWHSTIECHAKVYKLDHTRVEWPRPGDDDESPGSLLDL